MKKKHYIVVEKSIMYKETALFYCKIKQESVYENEYGVSVAQNIYFRLQHKNRSNNN